MAVKGVHAMFYSNEPEATRAFLRDVVGIPSVDVGDGWLIYNFAEADMGVHPTDGQPATGTPDISFYTDDVNATIAEMRSRGAEIADAEDHGYGFVTHFTMPGNVRVQLYQPKYR